MIQPQGLQCDLLECSRDTRQWVLDLAARACRMRKYIHALCREVDELRQKTRSAIQSRESWHTRAVAFRGAWEIEETLRQKAETERDAAREELTQARETIRVAASLSRSIQE